MNLNPRHASMVSMVISNQSWFPLPFRFKRSDFSIILNWTIQHSLSFGFETVWLCYCFAFETSRRSYHSIWPKEQYWTPQRNQMNRGWGRGGVWENHGVIGESELSCFFYCYFRVVLHDGTWLIHGLVFSMQIYWKLDKHWTSNEIFHT